MAEVLSRAYDYDAGRIAAQKRSYIPGRPLPRPFYTSSEVFNADLGRVWRRHWLYAGHDCQIPRAGDWFTWSVGHDQIVLVRGKDGQVRAFHNTCRHRGARVCSAEAGHSRLLVCPYHAWSYELDGRLRTATEREFGVHQSQLGLHSVQLRNLSGLLFIALGADAIDFDEGAEEISDEMRHQGFGNAKLAKSIRYKVKCNWKLIFENNRECYHCAIAHPEYVAGTYDIARFNPRLLPEVERQTALADARFKAIGLGPSEASSAMTGTWWRVTRAPLMEGWKSQSLDGEPVAPPMGIFRDKQQWSGGTLRCTVFPNFWQHASDDHAVATRLTPIDVLTTQVDVAWFVHRDAVEGRDYTLDRLLPFWQRTSEQDWAICEAQQTGVSSLAYVPGPYSRTRETNVQHFIDWYLGALDVADAAKTKSKLRSIGYKDRPGA
jgi:Rieske 2Fe-2S family protein